MNIGKSPEKHYQIKVEFNDHKDNHVIFGLK